MGLSRGGQRTEVWMSDRKGGTMAKKKKALVLPDIPDIADYYFCWWLDINSDALADTR